MRSDEQHRAARARLLLDRASQLSGAGRLAEAVPVIREAVDAYRELAQAGDAEAPRGLASSLTAYATVLLNTGASAAASPVIHEAVTTHRGLLRENRGSAAGLAESLIVQGRIAVKNMTPILAVAPLMEVLELAHTNPGKVQSQGLAALSLLTQIRERDPDGVDREWQRVVADSPF